jgi:hypothetical protein
MKASFIARLISRAMVADQENTSLRPALTPDMLPVSLGSSQQGKRDENASFSSLASPSSEILQSSEFETTTTSTTTSHASDTNNLKGNHFSSEENNMPKRRFKYPTEKVEQEKQQQDQQPIQPISNVLSRNNNASIKLQKDDLKQSSEVLGVVMDKKNMSSHAPEYNEIAPYANDDNSNVATTYGSTADVISPANIGRVPDKISSHFDLLSSSKLQPSLSDNNDYPNINPKAGNTGRSGFTPTVSVNIGRIEVRAIIQKKPSQTMQPTLPSSTTTTPALSLKDYLKQRSEGTL